MLRKKHEELDAERHARSPLSTTESTLLSILSSKEKNIFTLKDVISAIDVNYTNAKVITNRLVGKDWLIRLTPGKYLIVPLEAGIESKYSEHGFIIASHLVSPYYIGYQSALNYHGLTDRVSSTVFVVTPKRRKNRTILHTKFRFVTVIEKKMFGTETIYISNSPIQISDPEKTIVDSLDRPEYSGGIDEIAKTLFFEHKSLNVAELLDYAEKNGNNTVIKRLGYIFDTLKITEYTELFKDIHLSDAYSKLDPMKPLEGSYIEKWNLVDNIELSKKEWIY